MSPVPLLDGLAWPTRQLVERCGETSALTAREAELLAYLVAASPRVVSRDELLVQVWGLPAGLRSHTVQTVVYTLRQKIEPQPGRPVLLRTVRGKGYRWMPAPVPADRARLEAALRGAEALAQDAPRAAQTVWRALLSPRHAALDDATEAWICGALAGCAQRVLDLPGARRWLRRAREAEQRAQGSSPRRTLARSRIANVAGLLDWRTGRWEEARTFFARPAPPEHEAIRALHLGLVARSAGRWEDAAAHYHVASAATAGPVACLTALARCELALSGGPEDPQEQAWAAARAAEHAGFAHLRHRAAWAVAATSEPAELAAAVARASALARLDTRLDEPDLRGFEWLARGRLGGQPEESLARLRASAREGEALSRSFAQARG